MPDDATTPRHPADLELRPYQHAAIRAWFENGGRGIFALATGAGKTVTALATAVELYRRAGPPFVLIVVAPYLHLVRQWTVVAQSFGFDALPCYGPRASWAGAADAALWLQTAGRQPVVCLITTAATFAQGEFQAVLDKLTARTLLIADEVHNLGAGSLRTRLPERVSLRLGLSATPERWLDEDGTRAVLDYFGPVVIDLDLEQALRLQPPVLTPYTYHPIVVELEDDEREEYAQLTRALAKHLNPAAPADANEVALGLLMKRARLLASARQKLPALRTAIAPYRTTNYNLIYCGDGRVEAEDGDQLVRQVEAAAELLRRRFEMTAGVYTAETPDASRRILLDDFAAGRTQALVAIRCLDEGMDIPQVRRAFILASGSNPRQFIQRRGRVLRRAAGKESAEIFDFVVAPPLPVDDGPNGRLLRSLVEKEMQRVLEFARLATNGPQARARLLPLLTALRLEHL